MEAFLFVTSCVIFVFLVMTIDDRVDMNSRNPFGPGDIVRLLPSQEEGGALHRRQLGQMARAVVLHLDLSRRTNIPQPYTATVVKGRRGRYLGDNKIKVIIRGESKPRLLWHGLMEKYDRDR